MMLKTCSKIWQSLSNNQHCRFQKTLYLTKGVSCVVTRWIWEPETKAFDMVNNFIFIILKSQVRSQWHLHARRLFITQLFELIKHWLTKCGLYCYNFMVSFEYMQIFQRGTYATAQNKWNINI